MGARMFVRHQAGSIAATLVDFSVMIACVRFLGLTAVVGTVIGAASGAVTNFLLGRRWIFRAHEGHAGAQAIRYALVSITSLGLNAVGEYILHDILHIQYVVARAFVAIAVSVSWNFTMQRAFVFRAETSR
jgi:putative flippase GtrA